MCKDTKNWGQNKMNLFIFFVEFKYLRHFFRTFAPQFEISEK